VGKQEQRVVEERRIERVEPVPGFEEMVEEQPSIAARAAFTKLSKLFGEQAVKCIIRRKGDDKKWDYLETMATEDFSLDYVRDVYGGGEYQIQATDVDGEYVKSFSCNIDLRYKGKRWSEAQGQGTAPTEGNAWIASAIDKLGEAVRQLKDVKAPTPPDPIAMITALAGAAKAMMPPAPAVAPAPAMGLKDQIEMIKSVIDVGTTVLDARGGGGSDSGDAMVDMVSKLANPVIDLVKIQATREAERHGPARNPVTRPRLVPTPATAAAALPNPPAPPTEAPVPITWVQEVQKWVPLIVKRAQRNRSAEDTAFFVLDELSDVTLKKLAEIAALPDFGVRAAQILPAELGEYPEWITEFLAAVQDYLFGEDDDTVDGDPEILPDAPEATEPEPVEVDVTPEKEPVPTS
jgi:hypothetical protein